jgi:hypothetical protein
VAWIAHNDEAHEMDPQVVAYFVTSLLLADLFGVEPERVGRDVVRKRKELAKRGRSAS